MNELTLSPGVVQGAIELLEISARQKITFAQITASLRTLGNMPVPLVCNISQRMDWVPTDLMALHVPADVGSGRWESIEIPFHAFTEHFSVQHG